MLDDVVLIGRHPSQTVQLLDRLVSKSHARIERSRGVWTITDLGSRNGTFVNHRLIKGQTPLSHQDEILIGASLLRFDGLDEAHELHKARITITSSRDRDDQHISHKISATQVDSEEFLPEEAIDVEQTLREDYERLRRVYELSRELGADVDLNLILEKLAERVLSWMGADRCVVLLHKDGLGDEPAKPIQDHGILIPRHVKLRHESERVEEIKISETILRTVVREQAAVLSSDARKDQRFQDAKSVLVQGIRSSMTVPMIYGDDLLGAIHVDSMMATDVFTAKDLRVMQACAAQAALVIRNSISMHRTQSEVVMREQLQRLLSPNLVERIVSGEMNIVKGGQVRDVTVIFVDIRGFTKMTGETPPQEVVQTLNEYFELLVEIVFDSQGTFDKFLGDGFMAFWGAPVDQEDHPWRAVSAALEMQKALRGFNAARVARGRKPIHTGIGIDTGNNLVGYMGSSRTLGYSVIGAGVNRASRLCDVALRGEVLVSESTHARAAESFLWQSRPPIALRGFPEPVECFRALADAAYPPRPATRENSWPTMRVERGQPNKQDGAYDDSFLD